MMEFMSSATPASGNPWKTDSAARRRQAVRLTSEACHRWFDASGAWVHPVGVDEHGEWINPPQKLPSTLTRLSFWLCMGLMGGEERDVKLANAILSQATFYRHVQARSEAESQSYFDIFVTNHAVQMLALHGAKLEAAVREKIELWARAGLADYMGNRQADYQFHGFNDNMPAKATLGLILGGEYFNDADALEHGLWNLRQLRDLLTRRGLISEYNSPTYTPFTLVNLTEIAQRARHPEARELAALCVERVWADVLAHFHAPTGVMGGPFSRAYHFDSAAQLSPMSCLLWLVRGDGVFPNPPEEYAREPIRLLHPHGFCPESLGRMAWIASCDLQPPASLADWAHARRYPFSLHATAERGGADTAGHAGEINVTHYQEADFSLGTAEGESWSQLQSEVFYLTYRRTRPAVRLEDIRVGYLKYFINGDGPRDPAEGLSTYGNIHTLQDGRTALVLARPRLDLAGKPITGLRLSFLLPVHFGEVERIEQREGHVFIEDGVMRLAIRPLNPAGWGGAEAVRLERQSNYQLVSLFNYEGPERTFTREELGRTLNGFAFTAGLRDEETAEAFQARVLAARCVDYWHFGVRVVRYQLGETLLEMNYATETDHVRFACVKGRLLSREPWQADGLAATSLPFLDGRATPNAVGLPYDHLRVVWAPDAVWSISEGSRSGRKANHGQGWR